MSIHKSWSWLIILAAWTAYGYSAEPEVVRFDRYGVILERKPFGEETVPMAIADPTKPILPPDQTFTAKYKMVAVTRNDSGTIQVGLVDLKSNRSFMLGIGDSVDGVEVVDADYVAERARLRRPPEDYWVSMKGGSNQYEFARADALPVSVPVTIKAATPPTRPTPQRSSYAARRQSREESRIRQELERLQTEEARKVKDAKPGKPGASVASLRAGKTKGSEEAPTALVQSLLDKLGSGEDAEMTPEEVNGLLQEYQKELIRAGQTPLPIPLSPETDRQLVEEGILPPQE